MDDYSSCHERFRRIYNAVGEMLMADYDRMVTNFDDVTPWHYLKERKEYQLAYKTSLESCFNELYSLQTLFEKLEAALDCLEETGSDNIETPLMLEAVNSVYEQFMDLKIKRSICKKDRKSLRRVHRRLKPVRVWKSKPKDSKKRKKKRTK